MTLASVSRYNPAQITETDGHGVVVGASMAGLLAARVLSDRFKTVTLIDKDSLPDAPVTRKDVPQGNHIHNMHEAGRQTAEDFFPGFSEELTRTGSVIVDVHRDFHFYIEGGFQAHGPSRIPMYCGSRPLFEYVTRRRVRELDGVTIRDQCQFTDYLVSDDGSAIEGVAIRTTDGTREELPADLVVDATGRTSKTPTWLAAHGYSAPPTDKVEIGMMYSTAFVRRPADVRRAVVVLPSPPRTCGGGMFPVENDRWVMTLFGIHGDHPPADREGFVDYAANLPVPDHHQVITEHGIVSEQIRRYPVPSSLRRRFEDLEKFPDGLVVIGDAIASFNPIYGQGMSVAALEALQLHHTLAADDHENLALEYFQSIKPIVEHAWLLSVGSDSRFSQTAGPKPHGTGLVSRYLSRVIRTARTDETVAELFSRIMVMERRPTSLFRPSIMARVLKPGR